MVPVAKNGRAYESHTENADNEGASCHLCSVVFVHKTNDVSQESMGPTTNFWSSIRAPVSWICAFLPVRCKKIAIAVDRSRARRLRGLSLTEALMGLSEEGNFYYLFSARSVRNKSWHHAMNQVFYDSRYPAQSNRYNEEWPFCVVTSVDVDRDHKT